MGLPLAESTDRIDVNSIVSERALHEVYYPPFEAAIKAGVASVSEDLRIRTRAPFLQPADGRVSDFRFSQCAPTIS